MIKKLATAGAIGIATLAFGGLAKAEDFPATPLQHGAPRDLPGENLIPGAQLAVDIINGATQPILQPILAPVQAPVAGPAPVVHHGRHHLAARHPLRHRHVASQKLHHKVG